MVLIVNSLQTRDDFKRFILEHKNSLIVVKFYADWCKPCKKIKDVVYDLFKNVEHNSKILINVNIESGRDIKSYFRIRQFPTLMSIKDGMPDKIVASSDIDDLNKFFSSL